MFPSRKALEAAFPGKGKILRGIIDGTTRITDNPLFPTTNSWIRQCYNPPRKSELKMAALDETLGTDGIEAIRGRHVDDYHYDIQATYCNTGDSYATTILRDNETGRYLITSWGDWAEKHEKTRQIV